MYKIIVDSTFGLDEEMKKRDDIKVIDLKLILDEQISKEGGRENWGEFYEKLIHSKSFPTTSQPNAEEYKEVISEIREKNPEATILIFTIASKLSGTINSATIASNDFEDVHVFDSNSACLSGKLLIEKVVELINENKLEKEELLEKIEELSHKTKILFVPETIEYLKRGGRIGNLQAMVAQFLRIKPIFLFKDNELTVPKKELGMNKAIKTMIDSVGNFEKIRIGYIHDKKNTDLLQSKLQQQLGLENVGIEPISPVFGVHVGIGAIGIAVLEK